MTRNMGDTVGWLHMRARRFMNAALMLAAPMLVICAIFGILGYVQFGSVTAWFTKLQGKSLEFESLVAYLAEGDRDGTSEVTFAARNILGDSVALLGAETSCGCVAAHDKFPFTLAPKECVRLKFIVDRSRIGEAGATIRLFTNSKHSVPILKILVEG